jgi:hypothetical protein
MLYFGQGVKANKRSAVNSLKYEQSLDAECNYILGLEHEAGTILNKSLVKALEYYEKAASKKYAKAKEKVEEIKNLFEEERRIEEEKKKAEAALKAQQELLEKIKEEKMNALYEKYKYKSINIPNLNFPNDFYKINLPYVITIYGEIKISYELKYNEKKVYIGVTGGVRLIGYVCKERLDWLHEAIKKYVQKHIDEFYEQHPDFVFPLETNYDYVCRYES